MGNISLRMIGPGQYSGTDERGVRFTVGESGPGQWTGRDERGELVMIRMTGIGQATFSRPERTAETSRPPRRRPAR